ncbi:hypothetical protein V1509DRAFT_617335 [Lipomyces kononenkoae]
MSSPNWEPECYLNVTTSHNGEAHANLSNLESPFLDVCINRPILASHSHTSQASAFSQPNKSNMNNTEAIQSGPNHWYGEAFKEYIDISMELQESTESSDLSELSEVTELQESPASSDFGDTSHMTTAEIKDLVQNDMPEMGLESVVVINDNDRTGNDKPGGVDTDSTSIAPVIGHQLSTDSHDCLLENLLFDRYVATNAQSDSNIASRDGINAGALWNANNLYLAASSFISPTDSQQPTAVVADLESLFTKDQFQPLLSPTQVHLHCIECCRFFEDDLSPLWNQTENGYELANKPVIRDNEAVYDVKENSADKRNFEVQSRGLAISMPSVVVESDEDEPHDDEETNDDDNDKDYVPETVAKQTQLKRKVADCTDDDDYHLQNKLDMKSPVACCYTFKLDEPTRAVKLQKQLSNSDSLRRLTVSELRKSVHFRELCDDRLSELSRSSYPAKLDVTKYGNNVQLLCNPNSHPMYAPSRKVPNADVYKRCEPYMSHLARAYRIRLENIQDEITPEELDKYFEYVAQRYRRPKNVTLTADLAREYFHMAYYSGTTGYFDVVISASMHLPVKSNSDGTDKINRPENLFFCFKNSLQDKIVHEAKSKIVLDETRSG